MKNKMNEKFIEQLNKLLNRTRELCDTKLPTELSKTHIENLNTNAELIINTGTGKLGIELNDDNTLNYMEYLYYTNANLFYTQDDIDEMECESKGTENE